MKTAEMKRWLTEKSAKQRKQETFLRDEARGDEAIFCKITGNVYDIFSSVLNAGEKLCSDQETLELFFVERLRRISAPWASSMEKAKAHGEMDRVYIETVKLDTVEEIRNYWEALQ